ncbi:MAG: site-specific integrase [Deltaproteobacteria bacterium]|nr:site-specific integrase [Deltaproteobacteria bacterium]
MAKSDFYLGLSIGSIIKKADGSLQMEGLKTDPNRPVEEEMALLDCLLAHLKDGPPAVLPSGPLLPVVVSSPVPATEGLTISAAIKEYIVEAKLNNAWGDAYKKQVDESLNRLIRILGDQKVSSLTRQNAVIFFDTLQKLPPNVNKNPLYKDCTVDQILKMSYSKKIDPKTVKDYMARIKAFSTWLHKRDYIGLDLFADMEVNNLKKRKKRLKKSTRARFDNDDLLKIFSNRVFTNHDFTKPYMYWLPLIALFSGMRMNEICQLRPKDFFEADGILMMDITEDCSEDGDGGYQPHTKSDAGRRNVPVHPKLVELGLLDYLATRKSKLMTIFDGLKEFDDRLSHYPSKWFNDRFRVEIGLKVDGKVFHSFRHTFIDELKQRKIELYIIKALVGHARDLKEVEEKDITIEEYGKDYHPRTLLETITQLSFEAALGGVKKWSGRWKKTKRSNSQKSAGDSGAEEQMEFPS